MRISKTQLSRMIKESIDEDEEIDSLEDLEEYTPRAGDYRGEADSGSHYHELFGDYVWPQHNPNSDSNEIDTRVEEKALESIINYYKNNNPFEGQNIAPDVCATLKRIVDNGLYPFIFKRQIRPAYRGMALYQEDYYQIFGQIPIPEETLTRSEAERFRTNPKESDLSKEEKEAYEKEYEEIKNSLIQLGADPETIPGPYDPAYDNFKRGIAMSKIPLKNYFERFISTLSRESQLSGTTNRYVQAKNLKQKTYRSSDDLEKRNFTHQDIEDYELQTGRIDSSYGDFTVSDWTKSKSEANLYAKKAAEILKAKKKDSSVIPFVLETSVYDDPPTIFSVYDALQNYPSIAKMLEGRLKPNDLILIGDASLDRVFVLDTRGMGLGYPVPARVLFSRVNEMFENALKGLGNYIKDMYNSTLKILGLREGKNGKIKMTKQQLEDFVVLEMARHYFPKGVSNPSAENRKTGMAIGAVAGSFYPAPYALGVLAGAVAGYFSGDIVNLKKGYQEGKIYEQHPLHITNIRKGCDVNSSESIENYIRRHGGIDDKGRPRVKYNITDFNLFGRVSEDDKKMLEVMKNLGLFETRTNTVMSKLPFVGDR